MKQHLTFFFICLMVISGCQPPPVNFFTADGYIKPYEKNFNEKLTFVFEDGVQDAFEVGGSGLKKMDVNHFRKSLKLSLYYTFINSFKEVNFADQIDSTGICVVLYRVRPSWEIKSASTSVAGVEGTTASSPHYDIAVLIRYDGIVYNNGVKRLILDNAVMSEKSATSMSGWPDVFRDSVKVMCGNLYKEVVTTVPYGYSNSKD